MPERHALALFACCALVALTPAMAAEKTPPKHTSTLGVAVTTPPSQLKPGEFIWIPEAAPAGPIVMIVSLPEQLAYVYRNGVVIGVATVFVHPRIALGSVLLCAFAFQNLRVRSDATIQANSPKANIGKIFAAYDLLYNFAFISGCIIGIAATSSLSYETVLSTACAIYFVGAIFFAKLKDGKVVETELVATHPSGYLNIAPIRERLLAN